MLRSLAPGDRLAEFEVLACLGEGGMGQVYRARDTQLGREVALKVIDPEILGSAQARNRFALEARSLAAIQHPNVATLYRFGDSEHRQFLAMELLEGQNLADRLLQGSLDASEITSVALDIARGMEAAHECGVLHRDLKPANIFLCENGAAKILDFGLAKTQLTGDVTLAPTITVSGQVLGTYPYMSPEQLRGQEVDEKVDLWAFGCLLYEMVVGKRAFTANSGPALAALILEGSPEWHSFDSTASGPLIRLVRRCLEREAARRPASFTEVRRELEEMEEVGLFRAVKQTSRPISRPVRMVLVAAVVAVFVIGLLFVLPRGARDRESSVSATPGSQERQRIAVLPFFESPGLGERDRDLVGVTLSEEVGRSLRTARVDVVGSAASTRYVRSLPPQTDASTPIDLDSLQEALAADHVLIGNVGPARDSQEPGQLEIEAKLIEVETERVLWRGSRHFDSLTLAQAAAYLADSAAQNLGLALAEAGHISDGLRPPNNPEVLRAYRRGRELCLSADQRARARGLSLLEAAWQLEPSWLEAGAEIVRCQVYPSLLGLAGARLDLELLEATVLELEESDPRSIEALLSRGLLLLVAQDKAGGLRLIERASALYGESSQIQFHHGLLALEGLPEVIGEWASGLEEMADALATGMVDPRQTALAALGQLGVHDFQRAENLLRSGLVQEPHNETLLRTLSLVFSMAGQVESASELPATFDSDLRLALLSPTPTSVSQVTAALESLPEATPVDLPISLRNRFATRETALALLCDIDGRDCAQPFWQAGLEQLDEALEDDPNQPFVAAARGFALAALGEEDLALGVVEQLNELLPETLPLSVHSERRLAQSEILARLGRAQESVDVLKEAFLSPIWTSTELLAVSPRYDRIRDDPVFVSFLAEWRGVGVARSVNRP